MRARAQRIRVEIRLAAQLYDALGQLAGVRLLLLGVFQELGLHRVGQHALGHEVMTVVTQHADVLGGQRIVQQMDDGLAVGVVGIGDRAVLDVPARIVAQGLAVADAGRMGGMALGWL